MIHLDHVTKNYDGSGQHAVDNLDLLIETGTTVALIGPSGCGKTTTMRMINQLETPTTGRVLVDGRDIARVDQKELRRSIGYVIQQVGLFPHMSIARNVATVPRLLGWEKARSDRRVDELLDLVGLDPAIMRQRLPHELSGGQRQRVGFARALAADPAIMLMDEPFGALDALTRRNLQDELLRIWSELKKTIIFVTHSIEEAIYLADRIVVMTYRPGTVKRDMIVELPRMRDPASADFNALKRELGALVMEEQQRHHSDELRMAAVD